MTFIWPWMLLSLLLVPLLIAIYLRLLRRRQRTLAGLGPLGLVQNEAGRRIGRRRYVPPLFFLGGLTLLLIGLSRPEMPVNLPRVEGTVILAFDVSNSMDADDLEPTRMEAAKSAARAFVENQPATIQIGVVAFSSGGLVIQPPTSDQVAILAAIDRLSPQGGTSLGQGIFAALNAIAGETLAIDETTLEEGTPAFQVDDFPSAVVLLLTDGENTEEIDPLAVAQLAADAGVRVYPVGIGSEEGTVLEVDGFSRVTRLDDTALREIAGLTNGVYYQAGDNESLQEIYENVDLQLTIAGEKTEVTAVLAGLSSLLLIVGGGLSLLWFGRAPA